MLAVLWFTVFCFTVGANEYHAMTFEEMRAALESLYTSAPDEVVYARYPETSTSTTEGYRGSSSTHSSSTHSSPASPTVPSSSVYSSSTSQDERYSTTVPTSTGHPEESSEAHVPCEEHPHETADRHPIQVGSIRGIPGINFPDYTDIPLTSFSCSDKVYVPGFYADMETGCQVFHVCWPHRRESFLCPLGTTFNQAILACDYWYSSNCSLASHYYDVNAASPNEGVEHKDSDLGSMIDILLEKGYIEPTKAPSEHSSESVSEYPHSSDLSYILKFLPIKAKVVVYPETSGRRSKIVAEASVGKIKKQKVHTIERVPERKDVLEPSTSEPIYVPVPQKSTTVRPPPQHTSYPKTVSPKPTHDGATSDYSRIIDQVYELAKKLVAEGFVPKFDKKLHQEEEKPVPVSKPLPLTKLNPRFIIKPVQAPKRKVIYRPVVIRSPVEVPKVSQTYVLTRPQAKAPLSTHKHRISIAADSHRLTVSPLTKKALTENYLKLLKIRL